ncbi:substrate-binding domain-containing protein [Vulcanisaeta thermophila]|uniref:substrate-binding domain-containing protein n=1 Tax=Vulcanisaeta thermophila TaxID=867917 RepID=UPI000A9A3449|nr:substrate-binding domain-containing protein [Vulcanisaeta thermophila]
MSRLYALIILSIMLGIAMGYPMGYFTHTAKPCTTGGAYLGVITASLYADLFRDAGQSLGINTVVTGMGSVQAARQVILNPTGYSIYTSIDPYILTSLLYPNNITSWYIAIAGDEMVIAYSPHMPQQLLNEVNALTNEEREALAAGNYTRAMAITREFLDLIFSNSTKALAHQYGAYVIGTSNPNTDPEGYRALMVLELTGIYWGLGKDYYVNLFNEFNSTGNVYEVLAGSQLFGPVESGKVWFDIAIYKSSAVSAGLPYFPLPPMVNLGDPGYSSFYSRASVTITVGGQSLVVRGAPIQLALTIPNQGPNKVVAEELIIYLISPQGHELMRKLGINPLTPAILYGNLSDVPTLIRSLVNSSLLIYGG